ncbi:MAG: DUF3795 domain-containing protein [Deltaproteobacteria bacterium]|nr:DUF3795 domain-containing protein [Deltaproteobacteria bacterium]
MTTDPAFISPCSLYCGVCAIHVAHRDGNEKLKERLVALYQGNTGGKGALPNAGGLTAADIRCNGCLSDDSFMHCRQCAIRQCTRERGYEGCHECGDFPCPHIDDFPMTVGKKVILRAVPFRREVGTERWIEEEEKRYHCPSCGQKAFRGATRCSRCKTDLDLD